MRRQAFILLLLAAMLAAGPAMAERVAKADGVATEAGGVAGVPGAAKAVEEAMAEGYLKAHRDDRGGLDKGPLFVLQAIVLEGPAAFTADRLGLSAYAGRPASSAHIQAIARQVRTYLLDHGHPFAEASLDFSVREDRAGVELRIGLRPGPGYKYGGTKQAGSRTRPEALARLALLRYGEDYSEERLRLSAQRLARTGYFEAVVPGAVYRDSTRNLLYPSLTLTDLKGNRLGGILGYDSERKGEGGVNGYLDIHLINMRGTARDLDFSFEAKSTGTGPQEKEARFSFTEPWILGSALGGRIDLDIALQDSVYQERNSGFTLFQDVSFHSRYSVHFIWQDNRDFASEIRSDAFSTGLGFLYDARDRVPGTLRGLRMESKVTGVRRDLGDSSYFLVQGSQGAGLWANRGRWVAHLLLSGGGIWPLEERANRGDLFELGGANTIRGYREKELLTNLYLYGNAEIQFLLSPGSRASLFTVPGLVNRLGGDVHWRRVLGYGLGLEAGGRDWTFGISYALNPERSPGDGFLHLRVINNF